MISKIITKKDLLLKKIKNFKIKKKKIVQCHGVFDVLHIGHINHFKSAKSLGDILVVSVTGDQFVNKGPNRPIFDLQKRMQMLASLECIDLVFPNFSKNAIDALKFVKPNIYCKGDEYKNHLSDATGQILKEVNYVKKHKGRIFYTSEETFSSSKVINNMGLNLSDSQKNFLVDLKKNNKNIINSKEIINNYNKLKVLVIGETIIDEYVNCEALGKSGKESVLALRELNSKKFLGGALSISNNLARFCKEVTLVSAIGEKKEFYKTISKELDPKIKKKFIFKKNSSTIIKKRYIDHVNNNKIIGVYNIDDNQLLKNEEKRFNKILKTEIIKADLVIVSDFGHGLISKKTADLILKNSKFLAINAQLNAANIGHHTISKYKGADLIIINENEMRHELRNKNDKTENLIKILSKNLKSKFTVVTSGSNGSKIYIKNKNSIITCPAFANQVVDKVGTGDTMLVSLAISIYNKDNTYFTMLFSALAAAQNIQYMANSKTLDKITIIKSLEAYLK